MDELTIMAAKIELLNDLVKIGIPALIGIVSGFIPYFIEKRKFSFKQQQDLIMYKRERMSELIDVLSVYSGIMYKHLTLVKNYTAADPQDYMSLDEHEEYLNNVKKSSSELLVNDFKLKKAKAIIGVLGSKKVYGLIVSYEKSSNELLSSILNDSDDIEIKVNAFKEAENLVLGSLDDVL